MKKTNLIQSLIIGAGVVSAMAAAPAAFAGGKGCTEYRLSAYGGDAGFRVMSGSRDFRKTHNGSVVGHICQNGHVQVELSKRDPGTRVALAVNGRKYVFGQGDRGDRHVNNWFRRYINIDLGHYSQSKPHKWKHKDHDESGYSNNHRYNQDYNRNHSEYRHRNYDDGYYGNRRYRHQGAGYDNHGYQDDYASDNDYDHNYNRGHHHGHKWKHKKLPRIAVHSKRHRKAHRRSIPHRHKRHHSQRYVTYY